MLEVLLKPSTEFVHYSKHIRFEALSTYKFQYLMWISSEHHGIVLTPPPPNWYYIVIVVKYLVFLSIRQYLKHPLACIEIYYTRSEYQVFLEEKKMATEQV